MSGASLHVRIKREAATIFLTVDPSDTFATIKDKVGELTKTEPNRIRLLGGDRTKILEDEGTIADQQIECDDVLYWVMKNDSGAYEEVSVDGDGGGKEKK